MFSTTGTPSIASRIGSLDKVVFGALVVWLVLFIAAAVAWRWPVLREIRAGERRRPDASIYGGLLRLQPGVAPIRWLLLALLLFAAAAALFQWGFPWAAANIPFSSRCRTSWQRADGILVLWLAVHVPQGEPYDRFRAYFGGG